MLPQFPFLMAEPGAGTHIPPGSLHRSTAKTLLLVRFPFGSWVPSPHLRAGNHDLHQPPWAEPAGLTGMCAEASDGGADAALHCHPLPALSLAGPGGRGCSAWGEMPRAGMRWQLELL